MDSTKPLVFVRVGVYLKQFAVIENATDEPLQYLTRRIEDPEAFQRYAIMIARQWDEMLEIAVAKAMKR